MAFIEKANDIGDIFSKALKKTLTDPDELGRGLELLVRGAALPDPDDSTGDFRATGRALGRFRQEQRKRDQEDIAAANAAKRKAEEAAKLKEYAFQTEQTDRELTFKKDIAEITDSRAASRHKATYDLNKDKLGEQRKKNEAETAHKARTYFNKTVSDKETPSSVFFNAKGYLNNHGLDMAALAGMKDLVENKKLQLKLYRSHKELRQAHLSSLNKSTNNSALKDHVNIGGAFLSSINNMLSPNMQQVPTLHKSVIATATKGGPSRAQREMNAGPEEWLSAFKTTIPRAILSNNTAKAAKIFGMSEEKFKAAQQEYVSAVQLIQKDGPFAKNPSFDNFIKNILAPAMKDHGADERFRYAFERKLKGTEVEGNNGIVPSSGRQRTTFDLEFLKNNPLVAKLAVELVPAITPEVLQALVEKAPEAPGRVVTTSGPINDEPNAPEEIAPSKLNGPIKAAKKIRVNIEHNREHWPGEVTSRLEDFYANIDSIKDVNARDEVLNTLKFARESNTLSDKERYNLYNTVFNVMDKHKNDFLTSDKQVNPYSIYALSLIDSMATSHSEVKGHKLITVSLTKEGQKPKYKMVGAKVTREFTDTFKRRNRSAQQRLEIKFQIMGMMRLNDMKAGDIRSFGEKDYAAAEALAAKMGKGSEIKTAFQGFIGTAKDLFKSIFGDTDRPHMASLNESTLKNMSDRSFWSGGREGTSAETHGVTWDMNNTNRGRMVNLENQAAAQYKKLYNDFTQSMKTADKDAKRIAYTNYLKRTALLWEKTALTYKLAGYVQGDQTGGRTISNQDFDNVYRALWGGEFFTEVGARNALRYLNFKNNEALERGIGEDLLLQATGETFAGRDRHKDIVADINMAKYDKFLETAEGRDAHNYLNNATGQDEYAAAEDHLRLHKFKQYNVPLKGVPTLNKEDTVNFDAQKVHRYNESIQEGYAVLSTLSNFKANMKAKSGRHKPTETEIKIYEYVVKQLKDNGPFGTFLKNNFWNANKVSKTTEIAFPERLQELADMAGEIHILYQTPPLNRADAKSGEGFNMLHIIMKEKENEEANQ